MNTEPTLPLTVDPAVDLALDDGEENTADALGSSAPAPRTRWAAIIWGAFFAMIAGCAVWLLGRADRREGIADWLASLTPGTITALALLSVGVLVLISGLVGLVRRAQLRRPRTRA